MSWMDDVLDAKRRGWSPPEGQQQEEVTMSEKYTPDETELIGCYAGAMKEQAGENYAAAKADAMRGIAKIKADAWAEGYETGCSSPYGTAAPSGKPYDPEPNPYRIEEEP